MTKAGISEDFWFDAVRDNAKMAWPKLGFPTKKQELWKYTSTDAYRLADFHKTTEPLKHTHEYPFETHVIQTKKAFVTNDGVKIIPILDAIADESLGLNHYLGKLANFVDGLVALNAASFSDGVFIHVPKGVKATLPYTLFYPEEQQATARFLRHLIILEEDASLILLEHYEGHETSYSRNIVNEFFLADNAHLTHVKFQDESSESYHVNRTWVSQSFGSQYHSHAIDLGAKWSRADLSVSFEGSQAFALLNGIYQGKDKQHQDNHTIINHLVGSCESQQDYKGILADSARAVFNGLVDVKAGASKTVAKQYNKNILLSKQAEIDTKPELHIDTDDVICSHGATVGQLDKEAVWYLTSRGISPENAEAFLIRAFFEENWQYIQQESIRNWLMTQMIKG